MFCGYSVVQTARRTASSISNTSYESMPALRLVHDFVVGRGAVVSFDDLNNVARTVVVKEFSPKLVEEESGSLLTVGDDSNR